MNDRPYFDKSTTAMLKGIALILMFCHHFFTFPEWIVVGVDYSLPSDLMSCLNSMTKICVPVFVFLNGYFEYYRKDKSLKNTIKKITDILVAYWISYFFIIGFAILTNTANFTVTDFFVGILTFDIDFKFMCFCWYISFYIFSLFLLRPIEMLVDKGHIHEILFGIIIPSMLFSFFATALRKDSAIVFVILADIFSHLSSLFPVMVVGYIVAKYNIFANVFDKEIDSHFKCQMSRVIFYFVLAVIIAFLRFLFPSISLHSRDFFGISKTININLEIIYAPFFVYSIVRLLQIISGKFKLTVVKKIGQYSMLMWYLSCMFFNGSKDITQKVLYFPKNPILVLIWGIAICLGISFIIDIPIRKLTLLKKIYIFKE